MYGSIVVKMDNSHLFEDIFKKHLHVKKAMSNEIYKYGFFSYMYMCVNVVMHFVMGLVTMIHTRHIHVYKLFNFFIRLHSIHSCILYP